jgi:hypothetical protein
MKNYPLIAFSVILPVLFGLRIAFVGNDSPFLDVLLVAIAPWTFVILLGLNTSYRKRTKWLWLFAFILLMGLAEWIALQFEDQIVRPDGSLVNMYGLRAIYPVLWPVYLTGLSGTMFSIIGPKSWKLRIAFGVLSFFLLMYVFVWR